MGGPHRSRARRGAVIGAILGVLKDGPKHGYGIMDELESKSEGRWRPSPGSVYPTLGRLVHKGLITEVESTDPKEFKLTEAGSQWLEANADREGMPFTEGSSNSLRGSVAQLVGAAKQLGRHGTDEQRTAANLIIEQAARSLYAMLAAAPTETAEQADPTATTPNTNTELAE